MKLPDGWRSARLGKVVEVLYGRALPASQRTPDGRYPIVGSAGRMPSRTDNPLTAGPALVVGRKGNVGHVTYEPSGSWPVDTTYYIEPPTGVFDGRFLFFQLTHLDLKKLNSSTAVPSLRRPDLERQVLAIPPPDEQRRIVDILEDHLSRLDAATDLIERANVLLHALLRSVLQAGLRGALPGVPEAAHGDPDGIPPGAEVPSSDFVDGERVWQVPEGWCWTRIGRVFDVRVGTTPSRTDPRLWVGDLPWVSSGEVAFNRIASTRETISRPPNSHRVHPPGTVLLAMIGEGKTRGQAAILDVEAAHNQNCASIRLDATTVMPEYVYYFLRERYLVTRRAAAGGNQAALNKRVVGSIPIPIPPRHVQEHLVSVFERHSEAVAQLAREARSARARAAALRRALLAAAFSGRLTGRSSDLDLAEEFAS